MSSSAAPPERPNFRTCSSWPPTSTWPSGAIIIGDVTTDHAGTSVSSAGDINNDGFDDVIVGAPFGDNGGTNAGEAYVLFGKAGGIGEVDLGSLTLADGFIIQGDDAGDQLGFSVSSAGDINNDGFDDLIIGAHLGDNGGTDAGEAYVLFGKASGFANIDLTALAPAAGFKIQGDLAGDQAGFSVSSAGDINGDGRDDLIVGARLGDNGGANAGEAYVIFGKSTGFTNIDLTSLAPADGFIIQGQDPSDQAGCSVSSAGDVNGDGYDDLIVGAAFSDEGGHLAAGAAYLIFGKASGFANIDLSSLSPSDGFIIQNYDAYDYAGLSVASAGDVNGDGFDDLIVGSPTNFSGAEPGTAFVIFGKASGFTNLDLTALAPADGFAILGDAPIDYAGRSVSSAGDINGDGFDDILVGAPGGDNSGTGAGEAYVIFGKAAGFTNIDLGALAPSDGFVIEAKAAGDKAGQSVSAAGDVNGDGFDDILVGAPYDDTGAGNAGAAYIIYGRGFTARADSDTVTEAGIATGNVFVDNGSGVDTASDRLVLEVAEVNGVAAGVGTPIILPSGALLTLSADGTYSYDPNDQFNYLISTAKAAATGAVNTSATDSFTYSLPNGSTATVTITITGVNSPDDELWGDSGNNVITGTPAPDIFVLDQGGNDTVIGQASGDDSTSAPPSPRWTASTASAASTSSSWRAIIRARSSSGCRPSVNVERIVLAAGFSYAFTSNDTSVAAAATLAVDASALGAAHSVKFNGGAETNGHFQLTGGGGDDTLTGGGQSDTLDGAAGADQMTGNDGNDTYFVDNSSDQAIETNAFGGTDTVNASATFTLGAEIETLVLTGTAAINGTGNALNNSITGNSNANTLNGGVGVDTMTGGLGNDIYVVDTGGETIVEAAGGGTDTVQSSVSLALGSNVENLTLTGAAAINGTGNGLVNILLGNGAANTLNGGVGADTMQGGGGNDIYVVSQAGDLAIETSAANGSDTVQSPISWTLGAFLDNLVLTGSAAINGTGNGDANALTGNSAANILNGGGGADTMSGGGGNDTYLVDNVSDVVTETSASGGTDLVQSSVSFTLGANVENLTLVGTAANGTGNGLANVITGNSQANLLSGGAGNDTLNRRRRRRHHAGRARRRHLPRRQCARRRHRGGRRGDRHGQGRGRLHARRQSRVSGAHRHGGDRRHRQCTGQPHHRQHRREHPQRRHRRGPADRRPGQRHLCFRQCRRQGDREGRQRRRHGAELGRPGDGCRRRECHPDRRGGDQRDRQRPRQSDDRQRCRQRAQWLHRRRRDARRRRRRHLQRRQCRRRRGRKCRRRRGHDHQPEQPDAWRQRRESDPDRDRLDRHRQRPRQHPLRQCARQHPQWRRRRRRDARRRRQRSLFRRQCRRHGGRRNGQRHRHGQQLGELRARRQCRESDPDRLGQHQRHRQRPGQCPRRQQRQQHAQRRRRCRRECAAAPATIPMSSTMPRTSSSKRRATAPTRSAARSASRSARGSRICSLPAPARSTAPAMVAPTRSPAMAAPTSCPAGPGPTR
jgi:Ca2+-binding RTX toxin-like protein